MKTVTFIIFFAASMYLLAIIMGNRPIFGILGLGALILICTFVLWNKLDKIEKKLSEDQKDPAEE